MGAKHRSQRTRSWISTAQPSRLGLGRVRRGACWGLRLLAVSRFLADRFQMQGKIFALVLAAASDVEGDTHLLQRVEVGAGCKDFFGGIVVRRHADDGQAVFGLAVRFVAVENFDVLGAAFAVEALGAQECNFHSRTCHWYFLAWLRVSARFCLSAGRTIPSR